MQIAIIDHGQANLFSLQNAFKRLGSFAELVNNPEDLNSANLIILPGVGAYGTTMNKLTSLNITKKIQKLGYAGIPILGICLGMQLLFESSLEFGSRDGIGLIPGTIEPIKQSDGFDQDAKIPHIGWSKLNIIQQNSIFETLDNNHMYFAHSYRAVPKNRQCVVCSTEYGNINIAAVVKHKNFYGFQFHPEKSATEGLQLLSNFLKYIKRSYIGENKGYLTNN